MATLVTGKSWSIGETVTPALLNQMVNSATISNIDSSEIAANANITAGQLAATLNLSTKTVTLPNASVTAPMLASTLDLSSSTLTLPAGQAISRPVLTGVREAIVNVGTVSAGTHTLNLNNGNIFQIRPTGNITIAFSNVPASGTFVGVLIRHESDGSTARTYTWPTTTKWAYNEAPTMTASSGKFDLISLFTYDGGSNWFGQILGQNY